jgi:hypothetical protein
MKKIIIFTFSLLLLAGVSEAQWSFSGNNIYNTNSGNVGIGNNIPGTLLTVGKIMTEPTITVRNFGGIGGATYAMVDDASGANWKFKATNTGGFKIRDHASGLDVFTIEPNSVANAIYINTAGNIGVKTTTPDASLSVANTNLGGISTIGSFQIGQSNTFNLVCDNNEVQARANGSGSTLYLQYWGGDINACASGGTTSLNGPVIMGSNLTVSGALGINITPAYDLHVSSPNYSAAYITGSYEGGTVCSVIASGTAVGTWGLYSYATTAGYAGYFSGNIYCSGSYLPSDEKLKENIQPLENTLDKVMLLDVKTYFFKQEFPEMNLPDSRQYGFTAQNIEEVFPELIKLNPAKGKEQSIEFKAVNYIGLIPVLTEAMQEQQILLNAKDEKIDTLQMQCDDLHNQFNDLQNQFNDLKAMVLTIQKGN